MKWLKYNIRTVVTEMDPDGNEAQREIFTEAHVPDNEQGRALAEKEAYNGNIEEYDDGQPEPEAPAGDDDAATWTELASALQEGVDNV